MIYILYNNIYIYIFIRGGTIHRCHGSVRTSVRGSRFNRISVQQEKQFEIYYAWFLFIFLTDSSANKIFNFIKIKYKHQAPAFVAPLEHDWINVAFLNHYDITTLNHYDITKKIKNYIYI